MSNLIAQLNAAASRGSSAKNTVEIQRIEAPDVRHGNSYGFMRAFFTYKGKHYELTRHPKVDHWEIYQRNSDGIYMFLGEPLDHRIEKIVPFDRIEEVETKIYEQWNKNIWERRDREKGARR